MNIKKDKLLEKIKKLNREKPLKEGKEIQRVLPPADADAVEQHEEALEANKKRLDPKNYEKDVSDLIKDTASEESRYLHFDVVNRKDLAKKINEAKEKKIPFQVARSNKEGFRYDFKLLKEEFMKKDAGDPEINKDAFNKATDIGNSLSEDYKDAKGYVCLNVPDIAGDPEEAVGDPEECFANSLTVGKLVAYLSDQFPSDSPILLSLDDGHSYNYINKDTFSFVEDLEDTAAENLDEELKIYTSSLNNFHPSKKAEGLWNEIKNANKIGDLEYALESLYPDGISDTFLDDMLIHEEEWIRDLIGVFGEEDEEEPTDEFDDDDVQPIDPEESDEEDSDDTPENIDDEHADIDDKSVEDKAVDLDDAVEDTDKASDKKSDDNNLDDDELDESLNKLAESFVNSQFKKNDETNCLESDNNVEEAIKCADDDDEVVAIDDSMVDDVLGMPKEEKK